MKQQQKFWSKTLLLSASITLSFGALFLGAATLRIPTSLTTSELDVPYLSELRIGATSTTPGLAITQSASESHILTIEGGLTIWSEGNSNEGIWSMIAGGSGNVIQADYATIAGGGFNEIQSQSDYSSIGGGRYNTVQPNSSYSMIAGWGRNTIAGSYSAIAGGADNTISANYASILGSRNSVAGDYSLAMGQEVAITAPNVFAWSDYDDFEYEGKSFEATQANSFVVRSLNGMGINTATSVDGLNVNVAGAVALGQTAASNLKGSNACTSTIAGTLKVFAASAEYGACLYVCDGKYRHPLNVNFQGDNLREACGNRADHGISQSCSWGGKYRAAGSQLTAYNAQTAQNCNNHKATITCNPDGTWTNPSYQYVACFQNYFQG